MTTIEAPTPYANGHGSGHQGGASWDAMPSRSRRVNDAVKLVRSAGTWGVTYRDLCNIYNLGHGAASSALSNAHRSGLIKRVKRRRDNCEVYVAPEHMLPDDVESPYRMNRPIPTKEQLAEVIEDWLENDLTGSEVLAERIHQML